MAVVAYPGTPGTVIYGGLPTPSGGTALTTITLANTSATEQGAGFVSPMFGLPLKQGDMPAGQYPAFFLADDTPVPATIHSVTSWPDGSMKWCGVFLRVPSTVAGSGTLAVTVKNGGGAPGSSARAVSDLTAADLKVELTGVTNLTGTWTASLNDAITNGTVVVIGDGPAGMLVRILGDFKQSGSAHGQLVAWHYALIAQNASGGLLGIRYLGRVAQPWADVVDPAPAPRTFTAALKSGASILRELQGTQGTLSSNYLDPNITLTHFGRFFTCGVDGRFDFVQGGGSAASDCTVRVQHDPAYVVETRAVAPFDLTVVPNAQTLQNYAAGCSGGMQRNIGGTGEREDIGLFPTWTVRHLLSQSANAEQTVRVAALASGGWATGIRKSSTKAVVACEDISPSYAGMGTIETGWRYWDSPNQGTMPVPRQAAHLWTGDTTTDHRPAPNYYAYLITGEPQFLDLMHEHATESLLMLPRGATPTVWKTTTPISESALTGAFHHRNATINGVTYKGAGILFNPALTRDAAWSLRDIAQAASISPDVPADGVDVKSYLLDFLESNLTAFNAYNALMPNSYTNDGLFCNIAYNASNEESPWTYGYLVNALCHAKTLVNPTGIDPALTHFARYFQRVSEVYSIEAALSYRMYPWLDTLVRAESLADCVFLIFNCQVDFSSATNVFTKSGTNSGFSVTNGDVFMMPVGGTAPFAAAVGRKRLYAVNSTGSTWQLSTTPGGAPETITTTGNWGASTWAGLQDFSPRLTYENVTSVQSYLASIRSCLRHLEAVGITTANGARLLTDANVVTAAIDFSTNPKNAVTAAYPA